MAMSGSQTTAAKSANGAMRLSGSLGSFNLTEVVQLILMTKKTGVLSLEHDGDYHYLYLEGGRIVHAEADGLDAEQAAYSVFSLHAGTFDFSNDITPPVNTLDLDGNHFLLEGLRRYDERLRNVSADKDGEAADHASGGERLDPTHEALARAFSGDGNERPHLSLVGEVAGEAVDLLNGLIAFDQDEEKIAADAEDLLNAFFAHETKDEPIPLPDRAAKQIAERLDHARWLTSYTVYSHGGLACQRNGEIKSGFWFSEEGPATVQILDDATELGMMLDAGSLSYALPCAEGGTKKMLFKLYGRRVAAQVKGSIPGKEVLAKITGP